MPLLKFEVEADYDKVIRLRKEIAELESTLKGMDMNTPIQDVQRVESRLAQASKEFEELTSAASMAGSVLEGGFKKKIYDASQSVNDLTAKIIEQKENIRLATLTAKEYAEKYKEALKGGQPGEASYYKKMMQEAKAALEEERAFMFELTQEQAKARLSVKALTDEYKLLKKEAGDVDDVLGRIKSELLGMSKNILGAIGLGMGVKEFVSQMASVRGEFQQIETSLEVLLGSEEKAVKLIDEVKEFAKVSPLDLKSTAAATQMMLGFNIEAEKVPRYLQAIGDISMGDAQRFNSLTLAFSQMSATGKLMGQDLNQMINAGFNPLQAIADKTGKAISTLKEEMSKGSISAQMVQDAFVSATEAGGKFYQMSEKASETINGQLSMLQDAMDAMFNKLGESSESLMLDGIRTATSLVENYETVGAVIGGLIATYGTYRTAVMVNIALTEGWAAAAKKDAIAKGLQTAATKTATIAQAAYNAVANANPYVLLATAVVAVASAVLVYSTRANKAAEAQKKLNKAVSDADAAIASEQTNIDILFNRLRNAKKGTEEFADAQKAIVDQYGTYLAGLIDEKNNLLDVASAYERVTAAAKESANARAMESYTKEMSDTYQEIYKRKKDSIKFLIEKGVDDRKLQNTLLQLINQDITSEGKLSESTISSIKDAVNKAGKWETGGIGFIAQLERPIDEILTAEKDYKDSLEMGRAQFGKRENEYESYSINRLKKLQEAISEHLEDGKLISNFRISSSDGTQKVFKETADAQLALRDIEEAIKKREAEAEETEKNKYSTKKAEAKKELEEAKKELKRVESDKNSTTKQYEAAKQRVSAAEAEYKKLGGDTTGKGTKAAMKEQKDANKKADDELALTRRHQQAMIDVLAEGTEKKIEQINLDYQKQKDAIDKQERELRQQNNGKISDSQIEAISAQHKANEANRDKSIQEAYKEEMTAMRDYIKEYGTFQQQKLAIAEEYAEKIAKATSEGEKMSLAKERDAATHQVDLNAIKAEIDWKGLFSGVGTLVQDQIEPTINKLAALTKSEEFKNFTLEEQQQIYDWISQLQEMLGNGGLSNSFKILGEATERYNSAKLRQVTAEDAARKATEEYERVKASISTISSDGSAIWDANNPELKAAFEAMLIANSMLEEATKDAATSLDEVEVASKDAATNLPNLVSGLQGLGSGSMSGILGGANDIAKIFGENDLTKKIATALAKNVGGAVGSALAGPMGRQIVEGVFSLLDIFRDGVENLFTSLIDTVLGSINGLLESALSFDIPIAVGKSLKDGIGNILNTVTFGGFGSLLSSSNAKQVAETTERLTARNEILCQSIDALKDEMSRGRGMKTVQAYNEAYKAQKELIANTGGVLAAQMGYHGAHHSNSYYIDKAMSSADWKQITALVGQKVASSGDLWNLSPEQLKKLQGNPELWTKIYTSGKYDKTEYLDQYIELAESLDELTEQLNETLTQISFDSMYDSFVDSLMDMDKKAEDVADDVAGYFMRAMLANKIGDLYADQLEEWYKKFANNMRDGTLDATERQALNDEYMAMVNEAMALRDQIAAATGYDKTASAYQQGSTGGYATQLSENTGSEMVGRATAILDGVYRLEALEIERNDLLRSAEMRDRELSIIEVTYSQLCEMAKIYGESYAVHVDCRRILTECYLELQQIRENTGAIIKPINSMKESLEKIEKNTKDLA
ncbi:MAG: tape measure protein [Paramuribaculum sp.]|nr:tape measure protein [Paramuribaculum sp.]